MVLFSTYKEGLVLRIDGIVCIVVVNPSIMILLHNMTNLSALTRWLRAPTKVLKKTIQRCINTLEYFIGK